MRKNNTKKVNTNKQEKKRSFLNWQNVKLSRKYLYVFLIIAVLFLLSGGVVYYQLTKGQQDVEAINEYSERVNEMSSLASLIQIKDVQVADYLLSGKKRFVDAYEDYQIEFDKLKDKIQATLNTDEQHKLFNQIVQNDTRMNEMFHGEISDAVENNQEYLAMSIRSNTSKLREETIQLVNQLMDLVKSDQQSTVAKSEESLQISITTLSLANISAIILGIILLLLVSNRITKNLREVVNMTTEVAEGNLRVKSIDYDGKDEIGQLASAANLMKDNIQGILYKVASASNTLNTRSGELSQSADEVREGSEQIASTMEELSTGSENQANSASNLAERMNDFLVKVQQSEENGQGIAQTSDKVLTLTNEGHELMKASVSQMQEIDTIVSSVVDKVLGLDKQSAEISKLVVVIKDIADQTNLLSLNAAIEAARAGEHGKGFAVVAEEVRKLSEQVAASVGEINTIVTSIQNETDQVVHSLNNGYVEVKEGTKRIEKTGENFETIYQSVTNMASKIADVSSNLRDIAGNSNNMNNLIEEIAAVSEESAAGVEQAAASAQQTLSSMEEVSLNADELEKLASDLDNELKVFRL
ncbi:methyl-accepting chemotaxis protein [Ornithinibacillus halotolerans]|uniref:Sensory transducer protein YvaQ n=1 Tax=Ornithinibacillus halotolerans TaxID=1274357 RepID=A0A916WBR1_9BACI|nr:methyl-accepting chemotaxis protein [Ornithinibacillus halotolerans]GGA84829.1 putative sensory transducer protein YvaQ [Ornithinibacillus halotolerans]